VLLIQHFILNHLAILDEESLSLSMLIDNTGEKIIDAAAQAGTASSVQNF
jgi:hypothetical protein